MPVNDDQTLNSSTSDAPEDVTPNSDVTAVEPVVEDASSAPDQDKGESTLDFINTLTADTPDGADGDEAATPVSPTGSDSDVEPKITDPETAEAGSVTDDEDFSDTPFHQHPRFQKLIEERNTLKVDATQFRNIDSYLKENDISSKDASRAIQLVALMRDNPADAYKMLQPIVLDVFTRAGEVMPSDLSARVANGELTQDDALALSRAKAQQSAYAAQQVRTQEQQQVRQRQQHSQSVQGAAVAWESNARQKDPDFAAKISGLEREVAYLQKTDGMPTSPQGVEAQLNKALASVNQANAARAQKRPSITPVNGGQPSQNNSSTGINSTLDIINSMS
jgi:hypothetical protein